MPDQNVTDKDRRLAEMCVKCPLCDHARVKQKGIAYWFVTTIEAGICPACQAYEQVYGRMAHEPLPPE